MNGLVFIGGLISFIFALILRGFVISVLWSWFVVPLGVMSLTIPMALGVSLMVATLTHQTNLAKAQELNFTQSMFYAVGANLGALLFGWIFTLFM